MPSQEITTSQLRLLRLAVSMTILKLRIVIEAQMNLSRSFGSTAGKSGHATKLWGAVHQMSYRSSSVIASSPFSAINSSNTTR